ncbi:MAG TPA: hypothetical protein VGQ83_08130 [Polyangia bacterium]|jgi:hypothetical protein
MGFEAVMVAGRGLEATAARTHGGIEEEGVRIDRVVTRARRGNTRDLTTAVAFAILLGSLALALAF